MEDFYYITIKLVTAMIGLFLITKLLGKKEISQLTAFDFVSSLMLSEIVGNTLYAKDVHFIHLLYALFLWTALSLLMEKLGQFFPALSKTLNGRADVIISSGEIDFQAMKRNNLDFDQLHTLLREQNIFSVREVAFAVFETNGNISVMRKPALEPVTRADMQLTEMAVSLPRVVIENGRVQRDRLESIGHDEQWLLNELEKHGVSRIEDILFAEWSGVDGMYIQRKKKVTDSKV